MSTYAENKKYIKKYMAKIAEIRLRMQPDEKTKIEERAKKSGKSVNRYILDLVLSGRQKKSLEVPADLQNDIRRIAEERGISENEFVSELIRAGLENWSARERLGMLKN